MTDEQALREAILSDPLVTNTFSRYVLADLLEEEGRKDGAIKLRVFCNLIDRIDRELKEVRNP